ncbi:DJ-1/PfpI family protein [Segetibacter koreensis]|uniref:DJ-1/PfpI family protein n=1 Tax=Segetibacter koreensis TaxID=398037 RepID=UPI00035E9D2F|nr:DJ-1/PfpI family protein [Segetibacter koreensis]
MKKIKKVLLTLFTVFVVISVVLYFALPQVFSQKLKVYKGSDLSGSKPAFDSAKKTVIIIADNDGTEMFDLMAPFYLFNATKKANVYVVSEKKAPILLVNSLFILPHYSFSEIDSLHITPDVIVIPNVTVHLMTPPKSSTVNWIKRHYTGSNIILSICDGSATAAATGLYDGKPITTHATDYKTLQKLFPKAGWVRNISVTQSGNLFSTAGVSNATEGSLTVIKRVFGEQTMQSVLYEVAYPHADIKVEHQSLAVNKGAVIKIVSKMLFRKNYRLGVLLSDSLNEFQLASVLDTYMRTFPKSINSYSVGGKNITSKYGLTLYPTGDLDKDQVNEVHVLDPKSFNTSEQNLFINASIVKYGAERKLYPIETCLERIATMYGTNFKNCVKLTLDYN